MGTCEPRVVKLFPSTSCSSPTKGRCYHVKAAQLAVGICEKPNRRQLNLTQLRKNKRKRQDHTCGRKWPRAEDVEIVAAGDADDADVVELVAAIQRPSADPDVEPDDVSPPNGALDAETAATTSAPQSQDGTGNDNAKNAEKQNRCREAHGRGKCSGCSVTAATDGFICVAPSELL